MRFEPGHQFIASARGASGDVLPIEVGFLRAFGVADAILQASAYVSRREKVCPAHWLIANGHIEARAYYVALSRHVGVAFESGWPTVSSQTDPIAACKVGCVKLEGARRWILAPEGRWLRTLLESSRLDRSAVALTTPAHLAALVHRSLPDAIEHVARDAFPERMPQLSARGAVTIRGLFLAAAALILVGYVSALATGVVVDLIGLTFFAGIALRMRLAAESLAGAVVEPPPLSELALPTYSVLVPLRDEAALVPELLAALEAIDYPRAKLEVLLLVEPEDIATRRALLGSRLPPWLHVVLGPFGGRLRTKPRALNIGLARARGTLVTVYDAEDRPDPDQLRRAAATFAVAPSTLACLQARLAIDPRNNVLTAMFALEYAALFDVLNVGTARIGLPLALGGTSNHFRADILRQVGGWDAWNVTEDADLGLRLARLGYQVGCIATTTREAAPDRLGVWMKQRRRWTKGWMQTLLVLARDGPNVARQLGVRGTVAVVLTLVNLVLGPLLFPVFALLVAYYLWAFGVPTPVGWSQLFETTLAACVLIFGTISTLWCGWLGLKARGLWRLSLCLPLLVPYQLMISAAAWMGLVDLLRRPYHWHKTAHQPSSDISRSSP